MCDVIVAFVILPMPPLPAAQHCGIAQSYAIALGHMPIAGLEGRMLGQGVLQLAVGAVFAGGLPGYGAECDAPQTLRWAWGQA